MASGSDYVSVTRTVLVTVTDDDVAGVSVSGRGEASLTTIAEGSSGTYTIVLDSQPTADVTVTINDPSNTDVTAEPASLTFSSTDWNTPKTVTVNAAQDADAEDETATVTHTVTSTDSSYSGASANSVTVSITDDEVPVTVQFGATTYEVVEGETVTVAVTLSADPERTVVIPITHTPQGSTTSADYSGVAPECDLQHGADVADDHLHGNPGRRGRRRQERAARLRDDAAGRGEPGHDGHDHRQHHRRRWRRGLGLQSLADHRGGQLRHVHHRAGQPAHRRCDRHHQRPIQHGRDRGTGQPDVLLD